MANHAFQLVVRKGPQPGQIFPLSKDAMSIGRDPVSDIVIDDPEISRHHARLNLGPSGYVLQDMASTNGSFVEGNRLGGEPVALKPGQILAFGSNITVVYEALPAPDPMATIVAPASISYEEELTPEEPPVDEIAEIESTEPVEVDEEEIIPKVIVPLVLEIEKEEEEEEEMVDEVAIPLAIEAEEEEDVVEVASAEPVEIDEAEIVAAVAAIEALEIEEEESIEEVESPESLEIEEDIAAVAVAAALEVEEVEGLADVVEPEPSEIEELEEMAEAVVEEEEYEDEDEDLPTIIDSPVVVAAAIAEPEVEPEVGQGFPSFDDVEPEPVEMIEEEPEPAPFVFEEPAPEPDVFKEPEPAPAFAMDPTEPDVDFQPMMAAQPEMEAPFEEPKSGRSNRPVIIGAVLFVLMCCCIIGLILVLVTFNVG
ncbi:MAG TPA: FHA domain-containing protein [candidate division Zixibacteria bacterium]|nr:FHA domain-containing protein [candidate division Zixibacteria bacterium]